MVSLYDGGVYLVNGKEIVPEAEAAKVKALTGREADRENDRKGTMAYSIMEQHNTSGNMENLKIKFDSMTSHDITFVGIVQTAKASGMEKFPIPYVLTNCHNSLCAVGGTINEDDHMFGLSAAKKYGGIYVPPHHRRDSSVYARDDGRLRQNDPWLRQPHPLRRTGHHGHRRGRRRAGEAASVRYIRRGPSRRGRHLSGRQARSRRGPPGHRPGHHRRRVQERLCEE